MENFTKSRTSPKSSLLTGRANLLLNGISSILEYKNTSDIGEGRGAKHEKKNQKKDPRSCVQARESNCRDPGYRGISGDAGTP
jgi:hypothetical protein